MNIHKLWLVIFLLCNIHSAAHAELILQSNIKEIQDFSYGKITIGTHASQWVTARPTVPPSLQIDLFTDRSSHNIQIIEIPFTPILLSTGAAISKFDNLIAAADVNGNWKFLQFSQNKKTNTKQTNLDLFSFVSEIIPIKNKYYAMGIDKGGSPLIAQVDNSAQIINSISLPIKKNGVVPTAFPLAEHIFAISNSEGSQTESHIWKLSERLKIIKVVKIDGGAASGISAHNGVAISYSVGQDVFVEKFDTDLSSLWRTKILTRTGPSTTRYKLCELKSGIGVVGANNDRMLTIRLDVTGKIINVTEDKKTALLSPITDYAIYASSDVIHIRGLARIASSNDIRPASFYFIDRPTH